MQNLSLVDYPAHLAASVFVQGCNFSCPYCQNPDLVPVHQDFNFSEEDILTLLPRRKDFIEAVVVTGGEPAIHMELPRFAARIKDLGLKVKLDTNGSNPDQLEDMLMMRLVDYVALDIKTSFKKYKLVSKLKNAEKIIGRSIYTTMLSTVPYEFRTTCVPGIVDEKDFLEIGEYVKGAKKYCLQQFRPIVTYDKAFQKIKPYPKESLQKFKNILKDFVEEVEIRGI